MARGGTLTINGLQLGRAGVGFHAEVLDPACVALVDIHKINGLPLGITWVTHCGRDRCTNTRDAP